MPCPDAPHTSALLALKRTHAAAAHYSTTTPLQTTCRSSTLQHPGPNTHTQDQALLLAELAQHGAAAAIWRGEAFPDTTFNRLADAVTATRQALLPPGDGGGTGSRSGGGGSGAWSPPRE